MIKRNIFRIFILFILFFNAGGVFAATKTWIGTTTSWTTGTNWSGGIAPTASDTAVFNTGAANCSINASITVAGFRISSGYTGTITQSSASKIKINILAVFSAGIFTGSNTSTDSIIVAGTFTLSGTTFTTTRGYLMLNGAVTNTSGTFTHNSGTVVFNSTGAQTIPAWNFFNLTSSSSGTRTLASSGTVGVAGTFNKGGNTFPAMGFAVGTMNYNGAGAQAITAFAYNNLTISGTRTSGTSITLASGTISIDGVFIASAVLSGGGVYSVASNTVNYSGAGAQKIIAFKYNNLTISGAHTTNYDTIASSDTVKIAGAFTNSATFSPGAGFKVGGSTIDYNGSGSQTITAFDYNNLRSSNSGTRSFSATGIIRIAGIFTKGTTNTYSASNSTIDYNGTGQQTVVAFDYYNLTLSGARSGNNNVVLDNSGPIKISRMFLPFSTFSQGKYITTGSTIEFNGTLQETIPPFPYNNIITSSTGERNFATKGTVQIGGILTKGSNTYTNNGANGDSFEYVLSKLGSNIGATTVVDTNTIYIAGDGGVIIKSADGGTSWTQKTTSTTTNLRDIEFYDANNGLAIGLAGLVLRTTNGGTNWSSANPTTQTLSGIYYMTSSKILITCGNGTVIRSTDGGASWSSPISTGTAQGLYGMYFIHADTGYVVGNAGVVYKTVNGGTSWTSSSTGISTTYLLSSVYFTDRNTGYIVGFNTTTFVGVIYKTTNGGGSWTSLGTSSNYYGSISFVNSTTGYISGGNVANNTGSVLVTRDAGATWTTYNVGTYRLSGMEMLNSSFGIMSGLNGSVLKVRCCNDGGTVEFNGTGLQRIAGTTTSLKVNKLKINKASGKLLLSNPTEVGKQLILTKGIIGSSTTNYLIIKNATDTVIGGSDSSYVCGPIKKVGNQLFLYPLGDTILSSGGYHPLKITAPASVTDTLTGQYFAANQTVGTGLQVDSLESISNCEYFSLLRNAGSTSVVIPSIGWNSNSCNVQNLDDLRIAGWDGTQWKTLGGSGGTFKGPVGILNGTSGLSVATLYLTFGLKPSKPVPYFVLKRTLDAGCYKVTKGLLKFKFDEEYNDTDDKLTFTIYTDKTHDVKTTNALLPVASQKASDFGEEWYSLNLWDCAISPTGLIGNGYYILEVRNEKNEKWYLRFKNEYSVYILCGSTGVFYH